MAIERREVLVWHIGRCGSTVLGRCLNQHSELHWNNEIFNTWMPARRKDMRIPSIDQVLESARKRSGDKISVNEIKFLSSQHPGIYNLNSSTLLDKLVERGCKRHVFLRRNNILKRMISHCRAFDTGLYHVERGDMEVGGPVDPYIMPTKDILVGTTRKSLVEWITEIISEYECLGRKLQEIDVSVLCLTYEKDIAENPLIAYCKVCEWLNIPTENPTVDLKRTSSGTLKDSIANYQEIKELLVENGYGWMIDS